MHGELQEGANLIDEDEDGDEDANEEDDLDVSETDLRAKEEEVAVEMVVQVLKSLYGTPDVQKGEEYFGLDVVGDLGA